MTRNKKNDSAPRTGSLVLAVALCAVFAGLGLGYVWNKDQIDLLGRQIKACEMRLQELQRQNKTRREQLATLCSPVALDARVKKLNLGLGPPALSQVVRLKDTLDYAPIAPTPTPARRTGSVVLAARQN